MMLLDQMTAEMKSHPITMVAVILLSFAAGSAQVQFAKASDVNKLNTSVERILTLQLASSIRVVSRQICSTDDATTKRVLLETLETAQQDYTKLTGERYPVQPCNN